MEIKILIMVIDAMNYYLVLFSFPATCCNVMNGTIHDSFSTTKFDHKMTYHDKTMIASKVLLIPSPLCICIVHVFDAMDHMTTLAVYQPCQ